VLAHIPLAATDSDMMRLGDVPDVAIELLSRTDRAEDLRSKLLRLRRLGAAYVVLLDPHRGEMWTDGHLPSGFHELELERLLRPLDGETS
jgi:Uma2 family endonuclease